MKHIISKQIAHLSPCEDAIAWLGRKTDVRRSWRSCPRVDWMLWLAERIGVNRLAIVSAACDCAELVLPIYERRYPDDKRPRAAIETARAWVRGEATIDQIRAAADAAYAAAGAATAAAAAADAAYAAADAAYADARAEANRRCVDLVRARITAEMIEEKMP